MNSTRPRKHRIAPALAISLALSLGATLCASAQAQTPPAAQEATSAELLRQEAEITRRVKEDLGPKRGFVTAATRDAGLAAYYRGFSARVECAADRNYPADAKGRALSAVATVSVLADGRVEKVEIDRGTGDSRIDDAVRALAQAAAPYEVFSAPLRARFRVLEITSRWQFAPVPAAQARPDACTVPRP